MLVYLVPNLAVTFILCDFERAITLAKREVVPDVTIRECFFHLAKNMKKHI